MKKVINVGVHRKALNRLSGTGFKPGGPPVDEPELEEGPFAQDPFKRNNFFQGFESKPEQIDLVLKIKHYFEDSSADFLKQAREDLALVERYIMGLDRKKDLVREKTEKLEYLREHAIFDGGESVLAHSEAVSQLVGQSRLPSSRIGDTLVKSWNEIKYRTGESIIYQIPPPAGVTIDRTKFVWAEKMTTNDVFKIADAMRERLVMARDKILASINDVDVFAESLKPVLVIQVKEFKINITN